MNKKNLIKFKETEIEAIPEEWRLVKLGDLVTKVVDNRGKTPPVVGSGHELLEVNAIKIGRRTPDYSEVTKFVDEDIYKSWFRSGHILEGDIIIPTVGTIGNVAISLKNRGSVAQNLIALRINNKIVDSFYIYYLLVSPQYREKLLNLDIGGVQPSIKVPHLLNVDIAVPPIKEQKRIIEILSSLDDKIELNYEIRANLERLASSIFKEWFIDIGEKLPQGWKVESILNYVDIDKGLSYKGSDLNDEGKNALVGLKCFKRGGGFKFNGIKRYSGEFKKQHLLKAGDLIVAMTDLTQNAEVLGKPAIVPNINNAEHIVASLDVSILRPKTKFISTAYLYLLFMRQETQDYLFGFSNGSTVLHLSIEGLRKIKVILPPEEKINKFNSLIEPIFEKMQIINNETSDLTEVKNAILPKLISGKIRVK